MRSTESTVRAKLNIFSVHLHNQKCQRFPPVPTAGGGDASAPAPADRAEEKYSKLKPGLCQEFEERFRFLFVLFDVSL